MVNLQAVARILKPSPLLHSEEDCIKHNYCWHQYVSSLDASRYSHKTACTVLVQLVTDTRVQLLVTDINGHHRQVLMHTPLACATLLMSAALGRHGQPRNAARNRALSEQFIHDVKALICFENSHCSTYSMVYVPHSCSSIPSFSFFSSSQLQLQQHHEFLMARPE